MNIDRVARAMVDVEPSTDLEARIRARLQTTRPARNTTWWSWRVGVPLAATAAIALALVAPGPGSRVQGPESRVQESRVPESRSLPAVPAPAGAAAKAGPGVPRPLRKFERVEITPASPSDEELAWMERRMPPLDPMTALQIDRIGVDSIQPEPLTITPLTISPVGTEGAG